MSAREPQVTIATGLMGVGKTFLSAAFIRAYHKAHPDRKILVFDPNDEDDYRWIKPMAWDIEEVQKAWDKEQKEGVRTVTKYDTYLANIPDGEIWKIKPVTRSGQPMSDEQKVITMVRCTTFFRKGLLLLEDVNNYIFVWERQEIKGNFINVRHRSQDILMHMQSINPLTPLHYAVVSVLRMHYDGFNVDKIKGKLVGIYDLVKIAQLIVDDEYNKRGNKYFHLYVHLKARRITGITREQFLLGCKAYLIKNPAEYRDIAIDIADTNQRIKPNHADMEAARQQWIADHEYYFGG